MHRSPFSLPFSLRSFRRGCLGGCFCFAGVHPRIRSAPSGPSLSLVRYPPRFAQGTNQRLFLGLGSRIRDSVCVVRRPPFSHYVLGRTPASERRNPRRGSVIKRFLGFYGSRSGRKWSWAAKSEPKHGFRQRPSPPFWGARRPDAGVRPDAEHPKGERCTTRTSALIRTTQKHQWSTVSPLSERSERWGAATKRSEERGAERMRGSTLAKHTPSPMQPLRAERSEEGRSQNKGLRQSQPLLGRWKHD